MPQPPIFFLTFANNSSRPLLNLEKESKAIRRVLSLFQSGQQIQIHPEDFATIDDIAHFLMEHKNGVALFHYGGHAGSQHLILRDQSANADGIAHLLAQQSQLKLVFLNGCSTREQVRLLLELGIPAVIATSVPIDDPGAAEFAGDFYKAAASGHNIREAFKIAAAIVQTRRGHHPQIHRGAGRRREDKEVFPWGLYVHEEKGSILEQSLIPPPPSAAVRRKNVLEDAELEVDSNAQIGNKEASTEDYDEMNVVRRSKIRVKGDFRLGDG